jgi:hypothetical protein
LATARICWAITMSRKTKFRLRIDVKLLDAVKGIAARRGISVDAFVTEAFEQVFKEAAQKEAATNGVVYPKKKGARLERRPLQEPD